MAVFFASSRTACLVKAPSSVKLGAPKRAPVRSGRGFVVRAATTTTLAPTAYPPLITVDWKQVTGGLMDMDISDKGQVYGVNAGKDHVYKLKSSGDGWDALPGGLKNVSVGKAGVWAVDDANDVYSLEADGSTWRKRVGALKQISSGYKTVWGIAPQGQVFRKDDPTSESWTQILGQTLKWVEVSDDLYEQVWGVDNEDKVFRYNGSGWDLMDGRLKQISVGAAGIWGVNSGYDHVWRWAGKGWQRVEGGLSQVASGGGVIGVHSGSSIWQITQKWVQITGLLKNIDVSDDGEVWGVSANDSIFHYRAKNDWENIPGLLKNITVGKSGVWGVSANDSVFQRVGEEWRARSGQLKQISSGTSVWGVNANNDILRKADPNSDTWETLPGKATWVEVSDQYAAKELAFCIGMDSKVYQWNSSSWEIMAGSPTCKTVSVGASGVWACGLDDAVYFLAEDTWVRKDGALKQCASGNRVIGVASGDSIWTREFA